MRKKSDSSEEVKNQQSLKEITKSKILANAPCKYIDTTPAGNKVERYPAVNCNRECLSCGWNPVVKKLRLIKKGYITHCNLDADDSEE